MNGFREKKRKNQEGQLPIKKCPEDGSPLKLIGSAGICDPDGRWEAETVRYRCEKGHMVFIAETGRIDEAEAPWEGTDFVRIAGTCVGGDGGE